MNCTICDQPLVILELDKIEVDYCTSCGGIWLDEGELELILEDSEVKDKLLDSFQVVKAGNEITVKCPICLRKMDKVLCGDKNKIALDECPHKHGLWFDKNELQNVVEMGNLDKENRIVKLLKEMFAYNLSGNLSS